MMKTYDMSRVHEANLTILKEIDRICRKYNIRYMLDAGTLIGAVRHKGFIPWDDDADVAFTRNQYEAFMKVAPRELPDTMFYSAFLGPIFAVMAVDYYILRKKKLNINHMYDKQGVFKGINWAAIIAIVIGSLCSLVIVQLSWYVSLIPTGLVYYFLMKNMKSAKSFRTGTIFQEQEG